MPQPVPIRNNLFIKIDKALIDEISTESGFKLYLAPEYNFEHNATISGTIAEIPKSFNGKISKGDSVAFSYHVVSDREFPNTADFFVPISEPSSSIRIWQNGRGEKLRMMAHQGAISVFWTGVFFNKYGQFEQEKSTQGTESQVERWMHTNFKFGTCEKFLYKNLLSINNQDYWKCSYENIFAKKEGDKIIALGDRIICKFIDIPVSRRVKEIKGIKLPDTKVEIRLTDRAEVISGGEEMGIKEGDVISFNERYMETYELWGNKYALIKKSRVEGKWQTET